MLSGSWLTSVLLQNKILQIQSSAAYLFNFVSCDVSGVPCGGEATAANIKRQPIGVCLALLRATKVFLGLWTKMV